MAKDFDKKQLIFNGLGNFITGLCALLFLIAGGLFIALLFKPLYHFDISYLNIVERSGYTRDEILLNYNALIHWCMPWVKAEFSLPTFPSSPNAVIHFEEVKNVFNSVLAMGFFSIPPLALLGYQAKKQKNHRRFVAAGSITLAIPMLLGVFIAADFNRAFVLFHEIVFRNDLWIFDYKTDPIITILPEAYFMHCAILILLILVAGACGLFFLGMRRNL